MITSYTIYEKVCDEVFGASSFVAVFPWRSRTAKADVPYGVSNDYEWILAYAKDEFLAGRTGERKYFKSSDYDDAWRLQDLTTNKSKGERPNSFFTMVNPKNGDEYPASEIRTWAVTRETFPEYYNRGKIVFPGDYDFLSIKRPAYRVFEAEDRAKALQKYGTEEVRMAISNQLPEADIGRTEHGSKEIRDLFGAQVFSYPKPTGLVRFLIEVIGDRDAVIMDFFAGSGTTGDAVLQQNAKDGGDRRFILVQLPEVLDEKSSNQNTAAVFCKANGLKPNLAEVSKERLRRAGTRILEGQPHSDWNRDVGFRVLKIDTSNMADVYYTPDSTNQGDLLAQVDSIKQGRTGEDLLFQVLVDWGVDLTLPIRRETVQGKTVFFVDDNALVACFDTGVTEELVKELAGHEPVRVVFRDTGFVSDAVKINVEQIFRQLSPSTEVKAI